MCTCTTVNCALSLQGLTTFPSTCMAKKTIAEACKGTVALNVWCVPQRWWIKSKKKNALFSLWVPHLNTDRHTHTHLKHPRKRNCSLPGGKAALLFFPHKQPDLEQFSNYLCMTDMRRIHCPLQEANIRVLIKWNCLQEHNPSWYIASNWNKKPNVLFMP